MKGGRVRGGTCNPSPEVSWRGGQAIRVGKIGLSIHLFTDILISLFSLLLHPLLDSASDSVHLLSIKLLRGLVPALGRLGFRDLLGSGNRDVGGFSSLLDVVSEPLHVKVALCDVRSGEDVGDEGPERLGRFRGENGGREDGLEGGENVREVDLLVEGSGVWGDKGLGFGQVGAHVRVEVLVVQSGDVAGMS